MEKTNVGCFCQQMTSSRDSGFLKRDHMRDLRRYLVLKYIQYLVLPSSNTLITLLGLLGSLYTILILKSPSISCKSTAVFISYIAKADILVFVSIASEMIMELFDVKLESADFIKSLLQNFFTANIHISCLLLSCVTCEALLITIFPVESRHIRTVKYARQISNMICIVVIAECIMFQMEDFQEPSGNNSQFFLLLQFCNRAASLLGSLSYSIGLFLRIINVYVYYKIFFNVANRSRLKTN
uniref:C-X-C chemokine receptor type 3-like n=1 Tax=Pelodiscus sinensis TaxID=13735 RepID=K7FFV4_PELSI|nr:C-X-C chemokine receptor type 3-like [Pelodiscus sinensis]|eukprot:XP_006113729.1 C-X-C chemokine receptor type 3-like [Pelodiscus sinensis]